MNCFIFYFQSRVGLLSHQHCLRLGVLKKLTDYKEEIHKCSKCRLCQSVCPVYQITGNDCAVSRGKFIMLNGIIKGDLKLNKNVNKYLDMCLKCNACKDFCPSGIDAREIFLTAKAEYFEKSANSKFIKILNSRLLFNSFMNLTKLGLNSYRFLRFDRILKNFYPILEKFSLGKRIILANEFIAKSKKQKAKGIEPTFSFWPFAFYSKRKATSLTKVVYFKGCVNEFVNPRVKNAVQNVLAKMGIEVLPVDFQCCGVPFLSGGNAEQFKKQAEFNIQQIPDEFDYFLTDCASCQNAFIEYENYIEDEKLLEKLKKINQKSLNIVDFVIKNIKSIEFKENTSFTFHKPCHLEDMSFLQEFLTKSKNVEYIEMKDFDKCCGFSGEFRLHNPELSLKISAQKTKNALETKADYILTSCPACVLGLNQGLIEAKSKMQNAKGKKQKAKKPILNFVEFISIAEKIEF